MTWLGTSLAWGSFGLVTAAVLPKDTDAPTRLIAATLAVLTVGVPAEFVADRLSVEARKRTSPLAAALASRLGTLSESLQAMTMSSLSLLFFSTAWRSLGARTTPLALASAPGALLGAL